MMIKDLFRSRIAARPDDRAAPRPPSVLLVVPCFNEASRLHGPAFLAFTAANPDIGFLFVNDGSADGTGAVLRALRESNPRQIFFLELERNRGKAEAVRLGMRKALDENARLVGYWDADLATPLEELPRFVDEAKKRPWADILMGSRVRLLGRAVDRSVLRHYLGRIFAAAASFALDLSVYDTQCGAKLFRASPRLAQVLERPFDSRWIFDVEILARFLAMSQQNLKRKGMGAAIEEIPLMEWTDVPGSKVKPADFLRSFVELLKLRRSYGTRLKRAHADRASAGRHVIWSVPHFDRRTGRATPRGPVGNEMLKAGALAVSR